MNVRRTVALSIALALAGLLVLALSPSLRAAEDKPTPLGSKEAGGYTVKAAQEEEVKAGGECCFILSITGDKAKLKAVRAWLGVKSAEGSVKVKAKPEGDDLHAAVEIPKPIPDGSQLWVELETAAGKHKLAFDYKK